MNEVPDKIARAKELIEQKKRELAENIRRKNEEFKKKERLKEIEKQKAEIEKIKKEKGIVTKGKSDVQVVGGESNDEKSASVYISDFESESGSELIEKQSGRNLAGENRKTADWKNKERVDVVKIIEVEELQSGGKGLESLETETQEKVQIMDEIPYVSSQISLQAKALNPIRISKESFSFAGKVSILDPGSIQKEIQPKARILNLISAQVLRFKAADTEAEFKKQAEKRLFFTQISELLESLPLSQLNPVNSNLNCINTPQPLNPSALEAQNSSKPSIDPNHTPSFSEKSLYFETFGNPAKVQEIKTIESMLSPDKKTPQELIEEEDNHYDMIVIENDTEKSRNFKQKKWEDKRFRRIEELEKRQLKKIASPERVTPVEKLRGSPSPHNSSPKPSPRPSSKIELRSSPKPTHKAREEIKSGGDKYRRHKNLPNLIYNKPTNRKIIKNAITQVCLAGDPNKYHREDVISAIDSLPEVNYFIIVFSEISRRDVRGVYSHDTATAEVVKVYGPGYLPEILDPGVVSAFFRYDSGAKEFKQLQCKDFITATDAVCLKKIHKVYENS